MDFGGLNVLIAALAVLVTAISAVITALVQRHQTSITGKAALLRDFQLEFFNKEHMREARLAASRLGLERLDRANNISTAHPPAAIFHLMDFFDMISQYYEKGAFDKQMSFSTFYYLISHYWACFGDDIEEFENRTQLKLYFDLQSVESKLAKLGRKLGRIPKDHKIGADRLREFFIGEIEECAKKNHDGAPIRENQNLLSTRRSIGVYRNPPIRRLQTRV